MRGRERPTRHDRSSPIMAPHIVRHDGGTVPDGNALSGFAHVIELNRSGVSPDRHCQPSRRDRESACPHHRSRPRAQAFVGHDEQADASCSTSRARRSRSAPPADEPVDYVLHRCGTARPSRHRPAIHRRDDGNRHTTINRWLSPYPRRPSSRRRTPSSSCPCRRAGCRGPHIRTPSSAC